MRRTRRRVAVCLLALFWIGLALPTPASAGLAGRAAPSVPATTAKWSAVFSVTAATASTSGAQSVSLSSPSLVWLSNNGTATLDSRFTLTLSMTASAGASARLEACSGTWTSVSACSGQVTTMVESGGSAVYPLGSAPLAQGAAKQYRVQPVVTVLGSGTATLNATVRR